uniref:WASH complex subunit 7 central domain-containing protein n=1 Tax=Anopheles culicifacies TaxID=139723 RepID=A0A182ME58_9DIPT
MTNIPQVNYAFQFLRQKLFTFSHFLYDEQIHSRLASDAKKMSAESAAATGAGASSANANASSTVGTASYTYDRALAFNRRIRNLGLSDDGETYVDLFRKLICQIGNAMAFIRMLHAGALHECTGAAEFISNPPMAAEQQTENDAPESNATKDSHTRQSTVSIWRQDMATVRASWRLENEFFRLLLNAFDGFRRRRTNHPDGESTTPGADSFAHLELFYLIIPPLTISYVEAMLKAKETIAKKDRHGTFLPTDDGFVMGLSYLLTLLNQTAAFNSLHWFKEVHTKYAREMAKLNQQTASGASNLLQTASAEPSDEKMLPTVSLTRKRLNAMQHEFELLQYNLSTLARLYAQRVHPYITPFVGGPIGRSPALVPLLLPPLTLPLLLPATPLVGLQLPATDPAVPGDTVAPAPLALVPLFTVVPFVVPPAASSPLVPLTLPLLPLPAPPTAGPAAPLALVPLAFALAAEFPAPPAPPPPAREFGVLSENLSSLAMMCLPYLLGVGVQFRQYRCGLLRCAVFQYPLDHPTSVRMCTERVHLITECVDDKLQRARIDALDALLYHVVTVLILHAL